QPLAVNQRVANIRLYVGATKNAPLQRAVYASSADPFATFTDDGFRSRGAVLKQDGINFLPLGGAGLRGFDRYLALNRVVSGSLDLSEKLYESKETWLKGSHRRSPRHFPIRCSSTPALGWAPAACSMTARSIFGSTCRFS